MAHSAVNISVKKITGEEPDVPETEEILSYIDVMMDGPYVEALKDLSAYFRGSSNQRAIDVPATLKNGGEIVTWEPDRPIYVFPNT